MVDSPDTPSSTSKALTIKDLPIEVLDKIFLHVPRVSQRDVPLQERDDLRWEEGDPYQESMRYTTRSLDYYPRSPPAESMLAPLRLSQVCRVWRDAATTLPALWTDINIRLYRNNSEERDAWLVWAVDTWLERSGVSPLWLSVECDTLDVSRLKFDTTALILEKLLDHQNRWQVAHFAFIGDNPKELPQLHLVDAPILESLFVCWDGIAVNYDMTQVHLDISYSPRLRSLHSTNYPCIEPGQLSGLRELSLHGNLSLYGHGIQRAFPLEIFRHMPNLEILKTRFLECTFHDLSENSQNPPIVLHKLHTLVLCCDVVSKLIVKRLTLPTLRHLNLDPFPSDNIEELSVMLERSQPPLEYLQLSGRYFDERAYIHTLLLCPSVKTLCISRAAIMSTLFDALLPLGGDSPTLCPNLKELRIRGCFWNSFGSRFGEDWNDDDEINVEIFCNMLEKRCRRLGLLGTVECYGTNPYSSLPTRHDRSYCFTVPFVCISGARIYGPLKDAFRVEVRFKKPLAVKV